VKREYEVQSSDITTGENIPDTLFVKVRDFWFIMA
jgi:hypothetical protein